MASLGILTRGVERAASMRSNGFHDAVQPAANEGRSVLGEADWVGRTQEVSAMRGTLDTPGGRYGVLLATGSGLREEAGARCAVRIDSEWCGL